MSEIADRTDTPTPGPTEESRPRTLSALAEATPASRNRVVDLLRAVSIGVVAIGHWLMAGVYVDGEGDLRRTGLLGVAEWTHPLTWVLQVMPVFFLVGGYANALSWRSARGKGATYGGWLRARLRRLILPVLPLMIVWAIVAPAAHQLGASGSTLRIASMASLVPTWFLASYVVVVAVAPASLWLWDRFGCASVAGMLIAAGLVDYVSITQDLLAVGFLNYLIAWACVHQLGYAWLDARLTARLPRALLATIGLSGLWFLCVMGPYAVSMVGVDGHGIDNAFPTRVPLVFLGFLQTAIVISVAPALNRLLRDKRLWMATIFVNARIMTIYLWHLTALGVVVALSLACGGAGLHLIPNSGAWWATRPLWFVVMAATTAVLVMVFGRLEQPAADPRPAPRAIWPILAMLTTCAGLGVMAKEGIATTQGEVNWWLPLVPVAAAWIFGIARLPRGRHGEG